MARLFALLVLLAASGAASAQIVIQGTVYDYQFAPVPSVVMVNTTPEQIVVAVNGSYMLQVPAGEFLVTVTTRDGGTENQVVSASAPGVYKLDFIVISTPDAEPVAAIAETLDDGGMALPDEGTATQNYLPVAAAIAAIIVAVAAWAYLRRKPLTTKPPQPPTPANGHALAPRRMPETNETRELMAALDAMQGIATQKELRKRLNAWSEARVSMVLTALEAEGKLVKIKKGRGNVIRKTV
ncbi:MAG: hypothetical protein AABW54_01795 [Candidatus Micrarchaeota archaeon]